MISFQENRAKRHAAKVVDMMLNEEPSLELVKRTDEVSLNRVKRQKREAEEELQRVSHNMTNRMYFFLHINLTCCTLPGLRPMAR